MVNKPTSKIIQIAVAGVNNNSQTQCNAYIYALCEDGSLWGVRDTESDWFCEVEPLAKKSEKESK